MFKFISDLKISVRLSIGFLLFGMLALITGGAGYYSLGEIRDTMSNTAEKIKSNTEAQISKSQMISFLQNKNLAITNSEKQENLAALSEELKKSKILTEYFRSKVLIQVENKGKELSTDNDLKNSFAKVRGFLGELRLINEDIAKSTEEKVKNELSTIQKNIDKLLKDNNAKVSTKFTELSSSIQKSLVSIKSALKIHAYSFEMNGLLKEILVVEDKASVDYALVKVKTLKGNIDIALKELEGVDSIKKVSEGFVQLVSYAEKLTEKKLDLLAGNMEAKNEMKIVQTDVLKGIQEIGKVMLGVVDTVEFDASLSTEDSLEGVKGLIKKNGSTIEGEIKGLALQVANGLEQLKSSLNTNLYGEQLVGVVNRILETKQLKEVSEYEKARAEIIVQLGKGLLLIEDGEKKKSAATFLKQLNDSLSQLISIKKISIECVARLIRSSEEMEIDIQKLSSSALKESENLKDEVNKTMVESNRNVNRWQMVQLLLVVISLSLAGLIGYLVSRSITKPINKTVVMLKEIAEGEGDLTSRLNVMSEDEVGQLSHWFNQFTKKVQDVVQNFGESVISLNNSSQSLGDTAADLLKNAKDAANESQEISHTSQNVSESVQVVADGITVVTDGLGVILSNTNKAEKTTQEAVRFSNTVSEVMNSLNNKSQDIGVVIEVIDGITEQINLLALNANIEAARAGDSGKGFAVVATEIKNLANETVKSTENIKMQVSAIQGETEGALESINQIAEFIKEIASISENITDAVEQQNKAANEIKNNVLSAAQGSNEINEKIQHLTSEIRKTSDTATSTTSSSEQLASIASQLQQIVNRFKY